MMMAPPMCLTKSHDDDSLTIVCPPNIYKFNVRGRIVSFRKRPFDRYGEQKMAQFRTHYLTKERSYVSTQQSGYFSIDTEMIEKKCVKLA